MKGSYLFLFLIPLFFACDNSTKEECVAAPDTKEIHLSVDVEQFQDTLANIASKQQLVEFLTRQPLLRDYIFRRAEYPNDSAFVNELYKRLTNPGIDTLLIETKRVFGDLSHLKQEFEQAFKNIRYYYPEFNPPRIQTVISGLDTDMLVSDSLIIVGLDFYLGRTGRFRPKVYDYLLRRYDPDDIVPSTILIYGISERFNKTNEQDKTVLADMIAYGKSFYFAKRMIPCIPDSVLISYTQEELSSSRKNQDLIWARFIESQVLYSTSHLVKKDYLGDRPNTIQVGEKCPGRIGQWVGWQIVEKYMENHTQVSLPSLMQTTDAQKLFRESRYKPERN
jgi:hypothetical protein